MSGYTRSGVSIESPTLYYFSCDKRNDRLGLASGAAKGDSMVHVKPKATRFGSKSVLCV